jgi:hypothetical protein
MRGMLRSCAARAPWLLPVGYLALTSCSGGALPGSADAAPPGDDVASDASSQGDAASPDGAAGACASNAGGAVTYAGACALPGPSAGTCTVLVDNLSGSFPIATAGGSVYYADDQGGISRVPASGGTPQQFLGPSDLGAIAPGVVTVDPTNLYLLSGRNWGPPGAVAYAPLAGGAIRTLTTVAQDAVPVAIAVDATDVYWVDDSGYAPSVHRIPIAGGPVTDIAFAKTPGRALALDDDAVYWTDNGCLYKHAKATAGADVGDAGAAGGHALACGLNDGAIALAGGYLYFGASGGLARVPTAGGTPQPAGPRLVDFIWGADLVTDGKSVFFDEGVNGGVYRYDTTDCTTRELAAAANRAYGPLAVDAAYVFELLPPPQTNSPSDPANPIPTRLVTLAK